MAVNGNRRYPVYAVLILSFLFFGCTGGSLFDDGVKGYLSFDTGGAVAGAKTYVLPLLRVNQPPYYVWTNSDGRYHIDGLGRGWWVLAASYQNAMAWSQPFYVYDSDLLVWVDLISTFIPIDGPVTADPARGHMLVASNIPDGPSYSNGLFLITREGWQEFFPIFDADNWEYGKPSYNCAVPGEVVFAAGQPGAKDIYRLQMFTGELYNLTNSLGVDENDPCFSPDGQEIVYTADALVDPYGYKEIWVMARDGSGRFTLMSDYIDTGGGVYVYHNYETPTWTTNNLVGTQWGTIAFSVSPLTEANWSIAVCSRDLQDVFWRLTPYAGEDDFVPTIHPSSTVGAGTLVYSKRMEIFPGTFETDMYNLTSQNIEGPGASVTEWALTGYDFSGFQELYPAFSRDGNRLSFVSSDGATDEVYGAAYTRNLTFADGLTAMEQWTSSQSGDIYVGPSIVGY